MIVHSLRWRLQIWHGLILVAVLIAFGLSAYHVARDNQLRQIDRELEGRLMGVFRPGPPGFRAIPPDAKPPNGPPPDGHGARAFEFKPPDSRPGSPPSFMQRFLPRLRESIAQGASSDPSDTRAFYCVLWEKDGGVETRSPGAPTNMPPPKLDKSGRSRAKDGAAGTPPFPRPGPPFMRAARTRGELREVYEFMPDGSWILVGRSMAPELATMKRLAYWLFTAGAAVLLLGLTGGFWLATRAIRPIDDISATAQRIAAGDLSQRINISTTDNELGRLAQVLNATFTRLEAAFAQQVQFTSDASHELRTPIAVILSQAQTALSRERAAAGYREALEACQRAAQRMRRLVESLLELARLDAGQEPMKRERCDLSRVARECFELIQPLAVGRGVAMRLDLQAVSCLGDAERIGQVVSNLLANAIEFNRAGGEVRVSTRAEGERALLVVADTGLGLLPEETARIFERFYRIDRSRSQRQGGAGLGLAICKAIVDAHGGAIDVSSQHGVGSTFTVRLPLG